MINELLKNLNEAENSRPHRSIEETIAAIDSVCAPDFEGRFNNEPLHDRETERQAEKRLFAMMPDYQRTLERVVVDPPYAAFEWIIRGTLNDRHTTIHGCSVIECNEDGLLKRGTVYFDAAQIPSPPS
jgi:hypothetical protein